MPWSTSIDLPFLTKKKHSRIQPLWISRAKKFYDQAEYTLCRFFLFSAINGEYFLLPQPDAVNTPKVEKDILTVAHFSPLISTCAYIFFPRFYHYLYQTSVQIAILHNANLASTKSFILNS